MARHERVYELLVRLFDRPVANSIYFEHPEIMEAKIMEALLNKIEVLDNTIRLQQAALAELIRALEAHIKDEH